MLIVLRIRYPLIINNSCACFFARRFFVFVCLLLTAYCLREISAHDWQTLGDDDGDNGDGRDYCVLFHLNPLDVFYAAGLSALMKQPPGPVLQRCAGTVTALLLRA